MRLLRRVSPVLVAVLLLVSATPDAGAAAKTAQEKRREVQRQKAEAARKVDGLKATEAEIEKALDALDENVKAEQARVAAAQSAVRAATALANEARTRQAETQARLDTVQTTVREAAVQAYVRGGTEEVTAGLDASSMVEMATKRSLLRIVTGRVDDVADELQAARQDLAEDAAVATRAEATALAQQAEVEAGLQSVKAARDDKQRLADQAEARLERALAEAASLEAIDRKLAAEIAAKNRGLAGRIGANGTRSGSTRVGNVSVTTVRGITVATSLADNLERLLSAAAADGINFGGGGYRDSAAQVEARRRNCGSSDYAIYEMPASRCHPPTARPGQSMHEQGLAIDFTYNGGTISSRSNPGYKWLAAHAGKYGLRNLPSEPWHWSTNGN